ncbi:MAG: hypothetical protein K0Q77_2558 [Anaerosporomusa subterranea]|nr:hypothetical protein [Anaerosporomusa subterranea]
MISLSRRLPLGAPALEAGVLERLGHRITANGNYVC